MGVYWYTIHRHKVTEWHVLSWRLQLLNLSTEGARVCREWRGFKRIPLSSFCVFELCYVIEWKLIGDEEHQLKTFRKLLKNQPEIQHFMKLNRLLNLTQIFLLISS